MTPSSSITISFDLFGSVAGAGGVFFAELFSEIDGGGTSASEILGGGPLFPSGTWTTYSFTTTTGTDVTAGVSVQFKADCGANPGCTLDAFIDNVSVTVGPAPACGDGNVDAGEQCDDGNLINGDGCDDTCMTESTCGDGTMDAGEQCDDGNLVNGDGCDNMCMTEGTCGDGTMDAGEQCDDGNLVNGDGCDDMCLIEGVCGDGVVNAGEQCDDGNLVNGDGCDDSCMLEAVGGNLAINGDFETGDKSGWTEFLNDGTFTVTSAQANGGTYSGNLVASVPGGGGPASFPIIKQANIGVGTVTAGTSITISFDLFGSVTGAGGVFFAELFSEIDGGGTSASEILGGGPLFPSGTWTNYSFTTTTGTDVSGGVTVQFKADCGTNAGCILDAYIDNVTVTLP